ncbi:MAG: nucleotide 5'-monophosphate nucleosidase PpnN [Halieaceae bacterium]|jgi:predicted Rossmann-fold nucleotide-binding protein|nr:nucleotide 5'-monophosphate nucleosidase PpnN [Halieaceae bacterium]
MVSAAKISRAFIRPRSNLGLLSRREAASLVSADEDLHKLFRRCALAILNSGNDTDDARAIFEAYADFEIKVISESRGVQLELFNAPAPAFVDGVMIDGIRDHIFTALRDVIFMSQRRDRFDLESSEGITDAVFRMLRNANMLRTGEPPNIVVCWGGHSIARSEYEFTKEVGYHLGLRHLDIATGCGPGAMKGPMKGAAVGHSKQSNYGSRFLGLTEPSIIASEPPNPIVNELIILPDIEKRLEAFLRVAHAILVFPGGAGTAEEILYLLGVMMQPENAGRQLPIVMSASEESAAYFDEIDRFIRATLGEEATRHYEIICGDPAATAQRLRQGVTQVRRHRNRENESYCFNWELHIPEEFQRTFEPTHENMASLALHRDQPAHQLASELRKAFSGIVAGNIKDFGVAAVETHGPYQINGDPEIMAMLDTLLTNFVAQGRMKLGTAVYQPCYELSA